MGQIGYLFNLVFTYPILNILLVLYHFLGDFGLAIMLLTLLAWLVLLPFSIRQFRAAKLIEMLQPQLAEIRGRHGGNLWARTAETQALHKRHGVRPLASYLPFIMQGLVFLGVFLALNTILQGSALTVLNSIIYPFFFHLSRLPDLNVNWLTIFNATWHFSLGQADPLHILSMLAGLASFVQTLVFLPRHVAEGKDAVLQATQMLRFVTPLISLGVTLLLAWHVASGVALYWTVSRLLSIVQRWFFTGWGAFLVKPRLAMDAETGGGSGVKLDDAPSRNPSAGRTGRAGRRRGRGKRQYR